MDPIDRAGMMDSIDSKTSATLLRMAGDIPGATIILGRLMSAGDSATVQRMWELGLSGTQIWVAFTYLGDETIETLAETVQREDLLERLKAVGY